MSWKSEHNVFACSIHILEKVKEAHQHERNRKETKKKQRRQTVDRSQPSSTMRTLRPLINAYISMESYTRTTAAKVRSRFQFNLE